MRPGRLVRTALHNALQALHALKSTPIRAVPLPAEPQPLPAFEAWMAELDGLQALRFRDPEAALVQVQARRGRWPALPAAEDALLHARCTMHMGAAQLMLGRHALAGQSFALLEQQLAAPVISTASPALRHHAQRCGIAGKNASAILAHALGDYAGALRAYLGALELARSLGDRRYVAHVLVNLANTYEESGLPAESLEHARLALEIALALEMHELVGDIHHNIGNALAACGELEAALASNQRALQAYSALALPQKVGYALVAVAERLHELGRHAQALQTLQERDGRDVDFVNQQYAAYAAYLRGRIAVALQQPAQARASFAQALELTAGQLGDRVGQARARLQLARLDLDEGALDRAAERAGMALALLEHSDAQRDLMQAHELLSGVAKARGDLAQALRHHEAFHSCYARCFNDESARKARLLAVRHEVDLARADAQRQRVENARLTEALAQIAGRLQRGEGSPAGPARPEDLQALGLTPREAQVLYWVTQGKTNEDVTQILHTSISAVKKHLGSIYDKLGVENRTAAANAARRARPL